MAEQRFAFRFDRWYNLLATPMLIGPRRSAIVLGDAHLEVEMGWGFSSTIDRSAIAAATTRGGLVGGIGVHGMAGRWLVNGSMQGLVQLTLDPEQRAQVMGVSVRLRQLTVSVVDPEGLVAALGVAPA